MVYLMLYFFKVTLPTFDDAASTDVVDISLAAGHHRSLQNVFQYFMRGRSGGGGWCEDVDDDTLTHTRC